MKRKILFPTDFSKNAWHAITYALELYKKEQCEFYILNVFSATSNIMESLMNMQPGSEMYETVKLDSENGLAKVLDMIALRDYKNPKHHFTTISTFNSIVEGIKTIVEAKDIEMVVMGTKGKTASRNKIFGTVAIEVMEKIRHCPVIVVPETAKLELPKEIVFPTGYKTPFKRRELNHLIDLAKKCDASIKVLHVSKTTALSQKQQNHKKLLEEYLKNTNHTFHTLSQMDIPTAINCFVESRESDMVAFINKKHLFFGSILSHPLVKVIGYNTKIPLLVMHDLKN
ncbi:Nucleotide-binding universal stress protein, UspA family [Hyunsoonleella jejuensis]|mgnify:CR=1 FL=1|uniref:Nucleotide-binding universal stress protein, UspA family n=1 Tax=Hyunsoonleella jejuensis TaxID=419940 RepID=A0A1H9FB86_9FLAO|nr:universal stress protein [Hyunsoonleella jejuensis]SEQ35190.1 Nucleotide-binding universal stress protein, UspA family [Hyunsoonleella jejuensis]